MFSTETQQTVTMASQPYPGAQAQPVYPQRPGEQDCRDYLRTGRCKYGTSCKYNHPPGVQSGGGMKAPEGGFPIRPNEPACQYYLKHGTCKFGQTCKFHHPPHVMASGGGQVLPANAVLMNVGGVGGPLTCTVLNADGSGLNEMQQVVQLLPQRPGQPDCIYFLRNGRCKYGATCKYHHPLTNAATNQQQQNQHPQPNQQQNRPQQQEQLTYAQRITRGRSPSTGSGADGYAGGQQTYSQRAQVQVDQPTHFLVSDGSFQAVSLRSSYQNQGANNDSSAVITSSSIASSYETAASSLQDYVQSSQPRGFSQQDDVAVDSSGRVWRRTTSGEHLASIGGHRSSSQEHLQSMGRRTISQERISRVPSHKGMGPPSDSGGSMLPRHESYGSFASARATSVPQSPGNESDLGSHSQSMSSLRRAVESGVGAYHPSYSRAPQQPQPHIDSDRSWAPSSSSQYGQQDYGMPRSGSGAYLNSGAPQFFLEEDDQYNRESSPRRHAGGSGRPNIDQARKRAGGGNEDEGEGLSMMTSALLNMLDTTDHDASGRDDYSQNSHSATRSKSSPEMASRTSEPPSPQNVLGDDTARRIERVSPSGHNLSQQQQQQQQQQQRFRYQTVSSMPTHVEDYEPSFLSRSRHSDEEDDGDPPTPRVQHHSQNQAYAPAWRGGMSQSRELEGNAQSVSMLRQANPPPPHAPPPGGFYLP